MEQLRRLVEVPVQYSQWNRFDLTTKSGTDKLKEDLVEKRPRVVWVTPPCTTQCTQQSQSKSKFHRIQMNILVVFLSLEEQDWCETDSGTVVGFDESWSWRCLLRVERNCFAVVEHMDVSGVTSLMERFLQNPGTLSVHVDVGQICCVPDDVFMIILIKHGRKKRCSTHRNWSRQL